MPRPRRIEGDWIDAVCVWGVNDDDNKAATVAVGGGTSACLFRPLSLYLALAVLLLFSSCFTQGLHRLALSLTPLLRLGDSVAYPVRSSPLDTHLSVALSHNGSLILSSSILSLVQHGLYAVPQRRKECAEKERGVRRMTLSLACVLFFLFFYVCVRLCVCGVEGCLVSLDWCVGMVGFLSRSVCVCVCIDVRFLCR